MKAFVINLDSRTDRWQEVLRQEFTLGFQIERVAAVSSNSIKDLDYATAPVHATWLSHQKAMSMFLDTGDDYGLILEDDFVVLNKWTRFDISKFESTHFDLLQIGYLITTPLDYLDFKMNSIFDLFLKILERITSTNSFSNSRFVNRLLLKEQRSVPFAIVCNDIRPGAHAYIVSRNFARAAQKMNIPVALSTDALYIALGWMRSFRFLRTRRSYFSQSDSKTSIDDRFLNNFS